MTDAIQKITAAASNGLTRAEVIATVLNGRALTAAEQTAFDKARGIWKLREAKRKAEKKAAGPMSGAQRIAKHRDATIVIDAEIAAAREKIDWRRRRAAEKDFVKWVKTYCVGVLISDPPPKPHGEQILREMYDAANSSIPYQILVSRGGGKTSYAECLTAFLFATGRRKFGIVVSINANQAKTILHEIGNILTAEPFVTDYPDIAVPIKLLDGHGRRSQRYNGHDTKVRLVSDEIQLPTIDADGACIRAKALKSVRGSKHNTTRPDYIILDDLQTREIAISEERVNEVLALIRGDVMGLQGKSNAAIISTATTIAPEDLTVKLKADKAWRTTEYPAVIRWPDEWGVDNHGLWGEYLKLYNHESLLKKKHAASLAFYRRNRKAMDRGADILNWGNYSKADGQISGLQRLVDIYNVMGHAAFMAEYQMTPVQSEALYDLTPLRIVSSANPAVTRGVIPKGTVLVAAATDINPSYALSTAVLAFDGFHTATVIDYWLTPSAISHAANDGEFSRAVYDKLAAVLEEIKERGYKIAARSFAWCFDASGSQKTAALLFARHASEDLNMQAYAFMGTQDARFNPRATNRKHKFTPGRNNTVLCVDASSRLDYVRFNKDVYEESAQKAWLSELGAPGGCSVFSPAAGETVSHDEFAIQVCNEKLKGKIVAGEHTAYTWKETGKHDLGDACYMAHALAGFLGLSSCGGEFAAEDSTADEVVFL